MTASTLSPDLAAIIQILARIAVAEEMAAVEDETEAEEECVDVH